MIRCLSTAALLSLALVLPLGAEDEKKPQKIDYPKGAGNEWLVYSPKEGIAKGKRIALLAGDEEYRSEELMPELGALLSEKHGFHCSVHFSLNPDTGFVDPNNHTLLPGLQELDQADLIIMLWRFRNPNAEDMKRFTNYLKAGKPIIALRTSTHAFAIDDAKSEWKKFDWQSKAEGFKGGWGKQYLGETWVSHWGKHAVQGTRAIPEESAKGHPMLKGVGDITGDTDVYEANPPADATILFRGQVLSTLDPASPPAIEKKGKGGINDPMQPMIWLRDYKNEWGSTNRILCSTMGSATDYRNEALRRLTVNAVYDFLKLPVPDQADVSFSAAFAPTKYGFNQFKKEKRPQDFSPPQ